MDLKDTIIKQLAAPVKRKGTQELMTDEEGNIVTSEAAIGMTIVQKALSGDLQAVAFVLNLQMQQQRDPKTGGVYDYGDGMLTINMDDIIYCVLADVTREQYMEWQEYICDAAEFGFDTPNLRSFIRGCPRTSAETFKHLREIKATLNDAIQDEKERMKNGKQNNPY